MLSFRYLNFEIHHSELKCRVDRTRLYVFDKNKPITTVSFFFKLGIWSRFYDSIKKQTDPRKYTVRGNTLQNLIHFYVNCRHIIWILLTTTLNMCLDRINSPENFWINDFHKTRELITHCAGDVQTYSGQFSVRDSRRWACPPLTRSVH